VGPVNPGGIPAPVAKADKFASGLEGRASNLADPEAPPLDLRHDAKVTALLADYEQAFEDKKRKVSMNGRFAYELGEKFILCFC
jgi:hypothetical protein